MVSKAYARKIENCAKSLGAVLVGFADLSLIREGWLPRFPENLLDMFPYGVSIAVKLPDPVIDMITPESPGPLYGHVYRTANALLDDIAMAVAGVIEAEGYRALPIPASLILTEERLLGNLSHKAVARAAGLGWIGRNCLLITPQYGPRVRFATVLTDMPLPTGEPMENQCGDCWECVEACPTGALKRLNFKDIPPSREHLLDPHACWGRLKDMKADPLINAFICGMCVKVCPWGKKEKPKELK